MTPTTPTLAPVEVTMQIAASPETVFRYFIDPARFAKWMGGNATIDPRPGGAVEVRYPHGQIARGEVLELAPPERAVFTWGIEGSPEMPAGSTRIEVTLVPYTGGTRVTLVQTGHPSEESRTGTLAGWTHYLSTLAADAAQSTAQDRVFDLLGSWGAAWSEPDPATRMAHLDRCWAEDGRFRNPMACCDGREALSAHMANAQAHMQGASIEATSEFAFSHNFFRYGWRMVSADGTPMASGTDVGEIDPDGRIAWIVGFWDPMPGQ